MSKRKEENQRKTIKQLTTAIRYRNQKILRLLDENRYLRQKLFEYTCAISAYSNHAVTMHPYDGYTDRYLIDLLEKDGVK